MPHKRLSPTARGFEPLRAEPNGFRVHLLSRSDTLSLRFRHCCHATRVVLSKVQVNSFPKSTAPFAPAGRRSRGGASPVGSGPCRVGDGIDVLEARDHGPHCWRECMHRQRGDSNPCGQSPMDFESISLAARTHCLGHTFEKLTSSCTEVFGLDAFT